MMPTHQRPRLCRLALDTRHLFLGLLHRRRVPAERTGRQETGSRIHRLGSSHVSDLRPPDSQNISMPELLDEAGWLGHSRTEQTSVVEPAHHTVWALAVSLAVPRPRRREWVAANNSQGTHLATQPRVSSSNAALDAPSKTTNLRAGGRGRCGAAVPRCRLASRPGPESRAV